MATIPIAKPHLNALEEEAVIRVLRSGWISQGPICAEFEEALAGFLGIRYAKAVNSGTSAIQLALLGCGVRAGDEVIVPAFTCVATLHPIDRIGACPVPVDIEPDTFGMDVEQLNRAMTPRTKAVVVVHLFGLPACVDRVLETLSSRRVKLIEDAALGLGGRIRGRWAGSFGDAAVLSFHPRKMITTGEGGMVLTGDPEIDAHVASLRNYGASVSAWERHRDQLFVLPRYVRSGYNYKMPDILAAVGLEQMKKLPEILALRKTVARRYDEGLSGVSWLKRPSVPSGFEHAYQSYVCLMRADDTNSAWEMRKRFFQHMDDHGIASVQGAQSMATVPYYCSKYGWKPEDFPVALRADRCSAALPMYPDLAVDDQDRIIQAIRTFQP